MKLAVQKLYVNPKYTKAFEWGRLITITGGAQAVVQGIGLICGILIVRLLPFHEYALYTLTNAMLGAMTLLADGGISTGVMAQGGKVWQDREKLGAVLATGLDLRRKYALGVFLVATPLLLYLLQRHDASWLSSFLIVLSLIPAFWAALSDVLLEIAPKLNQVIVPLQRNQVEVNVGRLFLLGISMSLFPFTFVAILAGGLPRMWANVRLRKISSEYADYQQAPDPAIRNEINQVVKRILPGAVYYCLSGQISIWLISAFGSTVAIAQIGALGRLSMVLVLFGIMFDTLIVPRFARATENKHHLLKRYTTFIGLHIIISIVVCSFVLLFHTEVLWILGKQYENLNKELLLIVVSSCLALISGASVSLYLSRGWVMKPLISISISLISTVLFAFLFDVSTLEGVLIFNICVSLVQVALHTFYGFIKIVNLK